MVYSLNRLRRWPQINDHLKNYDDLKNEVDLKDEEDLKNEDDLKNENNLKNEDNLNKIIWPPLKRILPEFCFMTSHLNSHQTTDIKLEMLSGVQTGNGTPHGKYNT